MIEQPLAHDDIVDHARLQAELETPICLDESIITAEDARKALDLGSGRVINIKVSRVGGLSEAVKIHDPCRNAGYRSGPAACTKWGSDAQRTWRSAPPPASPSRAMSVGRTSITRKTSSIRRFSRTTAPSTHRRRLDSAGHLMKRGSRRD
ncbi:MAG: enolase C-terminal domain-like protein [Thermomicrobiales bacterium]